MNGIRARKLRLNRDAFDRACEQRGWRQGKEKAAALGVGEATISRVLNGGNCGSEFVAATAATFGPTGYGFFYVSADTK